MGLFEKFFGGTSQSQIKGTSPYISAIQDFAGSIDTGPDKPTRQARKAISAFNEGNYDSNPRVSAFFAPIRDLYATSQREGARQASLGVGAKFGQDNPVLAQRIQTLNEERARDSAGQAMSSAIPAIHAQLYNEYGAGADRSARAQAMKGDALRTALEGYLNSWRQKSTPGIISALSGAAQGAASMGAAF